MGKFWGVNIYKEMANAIAAPLMRRGDIPQHVAELHGEQRRAPSHWQPAAGTFGCGDLDALFKRFPHLSGTFYSRSHQYGNLAPLRLFRIFFSLRPFKEDDTESGDEIPSALTPGKVLFTPPFISDLGRIINGWHLRFHLAAAPCSSPRH